MSTEPSLETFEPQTTDGVDDTTIKKVVREAHRLAAAKKPSERLCEDPGRSLIGEVNGLTAEITLMREQLAKLCEATRGLVTLMSVLDKKVDTALRGGPGVDCAVL